VQTPAGDLLAIDDPLLIRNLREGLDNRHELTLLRSHRSMTDCRPVSLFSLQTVEQLSRETAVDLDKRRFRANIYVDLASDLPFSEDEFLGQKLQIGAKAVVAVVARDSRCKMIILDPDTAEANPEIMRNLTQAHDGKAGVYGVVIVEGIVSPGDEIALLD
ncbi:MAG: MOSC domain-containing protein, partial [Acidobacteriaceae bacterium]|nr:MOSC domain-containing protein [Acidobacteriaceae bacterium]